MADKEAKRRDQWETLTPEDFCKAGESFDLFDFAFQHADPDPEEDKEYGKRNEKLLQLIAKKESKTSTLISHGLLLQYKGNGTPLIANYLRSRRHPEWLTNAPICNIHSATQQNHCKIPPEQSFC